MTNAAAGFRAHTGWAAAVVLAGPVDAPRVIDRQRLNMLAKGVPFECYHAAAALPRPKAEALVEKARATATELARDALRELTASASSAKARLDAVGVALSNAQPLLSIDEALSSHAMKHAAEGQLYRQALMDAAKELGLRVVTMPERDLDTSAATALGMSAVLARGRASDLGRNLGPPWAADQKNAALVAWLALASRQRRRTA